MVGTQDPFCKVSIQGANAYKQFRTRVINNGDKGSKGSAATWNEKPVKILLRRAERATFAQLRSGRSLILAECSAIPMTGSAS